jgi:hypothetical protein
MTDFRLTGVILKVYVNLLIFKEVLTFLKECNIFFKYLKGFSLVES